MTRAGELLIPNKVPKGTKKGKADPKLPYSIENRTKVGAFVSKGDHETPEYVAAREESLARHKAEAEKQAAERRQAPANCPRAPDLLPPPPPRNPSKRVRPDKAGVAMSKKQRTTADAGVSASVETTATAAPAEAAAAAAPTPAQFPSESTDSEDHVNLSDRLRRELRSKRANDASTAEPAVPEVSPSISIPQSSEAGSQQPEAPSSVPSEDVPSEDASSIPSVPDLPPSPHHEDMMKEGYEEVPPLNQAKMREQWFTRNRDPEILKRVEEDWKARGVDSLAEIQMLVRTYFSPSFFIHFSLGYLS